jgi:uncharacterized delta-60 repeat protein
MSATSYTLNYTIDATPPAVTAITSVAGDTAAPYYDTTNDSSTVVVYNASADAVTCKWDTSDVAYASMANTCASTSSCTLNLAGEGAKTVYMRCLDAAGLMSATSYTLNYTVDATPPAVTAITSVAGDTAAPYYDTTNDSSTVVVYTASSDATACKWDASDVAYGSMANTCASTSSCTLNLAGEGAKTVYMRCLDAAGLMSATSYTLSYTVDATPPAVTAITSVAGDTAATYYDTVDEGPNTTAVVYTASADATACRWNTTDVAYGSMANTCASTTSCVLNLTGQGAKTVYLRCTDAATNVSTSSWTLNYTFDSIAPTTSGGITAGTAGTNGWYTSNVTYTLTPADATSGVATTLYCVDTAGNCDPSLTYSTALTLSTESATNHVRWASTDNAGNIQNKQDSGAIKIDKTNPAVTAITSVAGDSSAPYYDTTNDSSTVVVYTASADATFCKWNTTDVAYSSMANTCASTSSCTLNLSGDGAKTVYMRCIDDAGLSSATSWSLSYTIDSTAPSITAFTATATSTTQVSLDPTANDGTGIGLHATPYDYRMKSGATCIDMSGGSVTGFVVTDPYTWGSLFANTQYSFDVRAKDALDNTSTYGSCTQKYTLANIPTAPTVNTPTLSTLNVKVNINSNPSNTLYRIIESGSQYVQADGSLGSPGPTVDQTETQWGGGNPLNPITVTGLSANTQYGFQVNAINGDGVTSGWSGSTDLYTLANTPGAPTCGTSTATTLTVAPAAMTPAGTEVAIRINGGSFTNQYIQANGSVGASAVWATQAVWSTKTVTGLSIGTNYTFDVKARNGDNVETSFGTSASCYTDRAPTFGAGPSDGGSSSSSPTNVGANVAFTATATDDESHQYYLALCKTNAITAGNNAAPTCTGGSWAVSAATDSASQASVNYTALQGDAESNVWYGFVCDKNPNGLGACSSMSQGSGATGSPFNVNHAPAFGTVAIGPTCGSTASIDPGNERSAKVSTTIGSGDEYAAGSALQPDGKLVSVGLFHNGTNNDFAVIRTHADGALDTAFNSTGKVTTAIGSGNDVAQAVAFQSDGKIVVVGSSHNGSNLDFALVRYNSDGTLDDAFDGNGGNGNGKVTTAIGSGDDVARSVALQSDGKIVVAGTSHNGSNLDFAIVRYLSDGTLDTSFNSTGKTTKDFRGADDYAYSVHVLADGKIVVAGYNSTWLNYYDMTVARYNSDGTLDTTGFGSPNGYATAIFSSYSGALSSVIQPDGKIVLAGYSSSGSDNEFAIARFNSNGSMDTDFDTDGKQVLSFGNYSDYGRSVVIQSDGKLVVTGYSYDSAGIARIALARFNTNGSLDTSGFGTDGKVITAFSTAASALSSAIQTDGRILAVGWVMTGTNYDFGLVRYKTDGSVDDLSGYACVATGVTDSDTFSTVDVHVCSTNSFTGTACSATTYCKILGARTGNSAQCVMDGRVPIPTAHGSHNAYVFVVDSNGLQGTGTSTQSYSVTDIAPVVEGYNTPNLTPNAGVSTAYSFTATISDNNGDNDVTSVNGLIYDDYAVNLSSGTCTSNEQNCYLRPTCTLSDVGAGTDTSLTATCSAITTWFNINPTGTPGTAIWKAHANPSDGNGTVTNAADSTPFTVDAVSSFGIPESSIDYGTLNIGLVSTQKSITLQNAGNVVSDAWISGTDMTSGANTMGRAQQHWSGSSGFGYASGYAMVQTPSNASPATGCFNANVAVRTAHASGSTDSAVYWLLLAPDGVKAGSYTGTNSVTPAILGDACQ